MIKVAVIDANAISRNLLTSVLLSGGLEVVAEANLTPAGLATVIKLKPQIVCMDIGDPGSDGLEKLDSLRRDLPKALLFLVSGKFDAAAVQCGLEHGVHGFIVKPFRADAVLGTIRRAVLKLARQYQKHNSDDADS